MNIGIVLAGGLILADPASPEVVPHGTTVISGNRLVLVNAPIHSQPPSDLVIDCSGCLIMPGLVNAHTHAAMSLLRGIADDLPLDEWLNKYIFPSEAKHVAPDFVYLGTKLSAAEMALGGITTFADGYFYMEEAARASIEVGLRAVIAQGILDVPVPDAPLPGSWRERARAFLAACPADDLITPALFCHSPYLCSPETFQGAYEMARAAHSPLFSHVSETAREVQEIKSRYGVSPVEHLRGLGILGEAFVAIHGVHLSESEMDLLAESGTGVVHCPESNMKLSSGAADLRGLQSRGVTIALGTDGAASNNNLDLFEEMRSASLMAKLVTGDPEALDARTAIRMATLDGARVLGLDAQIGSIELGKLGDLIVVDLDRLHLTPVYDPLSHLVYAAKGSDVRHVIVNGKLVVHDRCILTVDERKLKNAVHAKADEIAEDLGITAYGVGTGDD
ncbi:MAG: amidohydrolase [Desulfomonile tiedjei]|nr:amidohydrolase [Desulfomonile tiedjei]